MNASRYIIKIKLSVIWHRFFIIFKQFLFHSFFSCILMVLKYIFSYSFIALLCRVSCRKTRRVSQCFRMSYVGYKNLEKQTFFFWNFKSFHPKSNEFSRTDLTKTFETFTSLWLFTTEAHKVCQTSLRTTSIVSDARENIIELGSSSSHHVDERLNFIFGHEINFQFHGGCLIPWCYTFLDISAINIEPFRPSFTLVLSDAIKLKVFYTYTSIPESPFASIFTIYFYF